MYLLTNQELRYIGETSKYQHKSYYSLFVGMLLD